MTISKGQGSCCSNTVRSIHGPSFDRLPLVLRGSWVEASLYVELAKREIAEGLKLQKNVACREGVEKVDLGNKGIVQIMTRRPHQFTPTLYVFLLVKLRNQVDFISLLQIRDEPLDRAQRLPVGKMENWASFR